MDFYAAGTQKWLIAPFGAALAYVGSRTAERQSPLGINNAEMDVTPDVYFADGGPRRGWAFLSPGGLRASRKGGKRGVCPAARFYPRLSVNLYVSSPPLIIG